MYKTCTNIENQSGATRQNARKHISMIKMSERGKNPESEEEELKRLFMGIMEGYNDALIPPLSYFSASPEIPNHERISPNSTKRRKTDSESSYKERLRREQMTQNFFLLQSMVPSLRDAYKPSQERIIGNAVNYIEHLQEETKRLEGLVKFQRKVQKVERPIFSRCTNHSLVNVTVSNSTTFFAVQMHFRCGLVLDILKVLEKHQAEVMEARVSVNDDKVLTFTATLMLGSNGSNTAEKMRQEILTSFDLPY